MKIVIVGLCVFAIVIGASAQQLSNDSTRIYNGYNSTRGQFPHHTLLYYQILSEESFCGSVLITRNHVLTAAHCVAHGQHSFSVHLGALFSNYTAEPDRIVRYTNTTYVHPFYVAASFLNDIAILPFDEPIKITDAISPIQLPPPDERFHGLPAILSGFGMRDTSNQNISPILQWTNLYTIDMLRCSRDFGMFVVRPSVICATGRNDQSACFGDSGSGLITEDHILIGLTSFGRSCTGGHPTVFTRVTYYLNWINEIVGPSSSSV